MDGSRFDGITRSLIAETSRRRALQGVAGGTLAGLLGRSGIADAAVCVKPGKKGCKGPRNKPCCDGARCQGGNKDKVGKCVCKGNLELCGGECANLKKDKKHCGTCNNRCTGARTCKNGKCESVLGCRVGDQICVVGGNCPGTNNPDCFCITDVEGNPRCSDVSNAVCADCTSNADCGPNMACYPADIGGCTCDEVAGSNGNACSAATCDGVGSSSTGRQGGRPSFLR